LNLSAAGIGTPTIIDEDQVYSEQRLWSAQ